MQQGERHRRERADSPNRHPPTITRTHTQLYLHTKHPALTHKLQIASNSGPHSPLPCSISCSACNIAKQSDRRINPPLYRSSPRIHNRKRRACTREVTSESTSSTELQPPCLAHLHTCSLHSRSALLVKESNYSATSSRIDPAKRRTSGTQRRLKSDQG